MNPTFLRMSLCTALLLSSQLQASESSFFTTCPTEVIASLSSTLRFRDFESLSCVSRYIYRAIVKHNKSIIGASEERWGGRTQWIVAYGASPQRNGGPMGQPAAISEEAERDLIKKEFEFLVRTVPIETIEKFQIYIKPIHFKADYALFMDIVSYLKRMELQTLKLIIENADETLDWNQLLEGLYPQLPYLETKEVKVEFPLPETPPEPIIPTL